MRAARPSEEQAPLPAPRVGSFFLRVFVFGTGAAVMAVEFGAQRLIAPFFGSSQIVWGTLIGLILLALTGGYALGGRLADRYPSPVPLGIIVLVAGVYIGVLPVMARPLLSAMVAGLLATPGGVVLLTFAGVAALFIPAVAALGAASPYAVRLTIEDAETAGTRTGSLYAWSTCGSIAGTFLAVFVLIPDLGVRETLWLSSAVLIILGAIAIGRRLPVLLLLVPLVAGLTSPSLLKPVPHLLAEVETPYQFAQVYRTGDEVALSVNDAAGIQSVYTPHRLTGMYYDDFLTLPFHFPHRRPINTLLIGMAAGTIPTLFARDVRPYRRLTLTGVEIDPALTTLGRRYFHLRPSAAQVVHADGRVYLEGARQSYDLIMVDAYNNEIYIPFALSTREFFSLCRAHLRPGGILALNVNAVSAHAGLLEAFERTLRTVFPHVAIARARGTYNYLLVAGSEPLAAPNPGAMPSFLRPVARSLATGWHEPHPGPGLVLTDNKAPVEALTDAMILGRLRSSLASDKGQAAP